MNPNNANNNTNWYYDPRSPTLSTQTTSMRTASTASNLAPKLQVVRNQVEPTTGESFQLVRPVPQGDISSGEIITSLMKQYDYKKQPVRAQRQDLETVKQAFPKLANKLLETYDGSILVSDTTQDLIGERYLEEQIRRINEDNRKKSVLDKWSHLFYEGQSEESYFQEKLREERQIAGNLTKAKSQAFQQRSNFENSNAKPDSYLIANSYANEYQQTHGNNTNNNHY